MKLRAIIAAASVAVFATAAFAETVEIKCPTMVCGNCCGTVTKAAKSVKGVTDVKADLENKKVTVTYNSKESLIGKSEKAIAKAGYQADDVKADPKAYDALPGCCKK